MAGKATNLPAADRDYNIILDVPYFFVFKSICVYFICVNLWLNCCNITDFLQVRQIIKTVKEGVVEVKQENGIYNFLFYRLYEFYMGMCNGAKKTFNRGLVEVV